MMNNLKVSWINSVSFFAIALAVGISGCKTANKTTAATEFTPNSGTSTIEETNLGDSDSGKAMGLVTVHFPYDSFVLDDEAKNALKANAEILKGKSKLKVQVEGHCDQRGGIQYNIALGEKRANTVKKFLEDNGIAGNRLTVISYGKEKPVDAAENEEAYAKNRRANFVITTK